MRKAVIHATGSYTPTRTLSNQYFNDLLQENVSDWLEENVQIYNRNWCADDESTADLCERAARQALEQARLTPEDLDLIIIATDTPEFISPSTASVVQDRLGAVNAGTFDLNTACAGFVTAMDVAAKYIQSDEHYQHILVIGAYAMSKYLNQLDKKTVTLFADGAACAILKSEETQDRGFLGSMLRSQGQYNEWMGIYAGGTREPITEAVVSQQDHKLKFVKRFPKELNPEVWSQMIRDLCAKAGVEPADISQFLITQININSIWETMDRLELPRAKAHTVMHHNGYTGSACIPMALHDALGHGKIKRGDLLFFLGSGGGLSFAGALFRY
ncbi:ketoacyl-ACP synthase III [Pontibacter sp. G13]|uniref:3-oxoacyl-ACP synthase III family protein n=1 Tax=Pontibacter sp. G13 TaxID=3074898 RepID=UPI00288B184C|nr:ketoacyl-ACP synthase III [Pontibacter sp. G13]WNJ20469.1 ketoacyl-ACP synthase III [Pontibacter sp. G13]